MAEPPRPPLSADVRRMVFSGAVWAFGIGLVLPLTLIYLHRVRHFPLTTTGLLLSIPGVVGLLAVPVSGSLVDRVGARRVLIGCLGLEVLAQLGLATVRTVPWAVGVLMLQGLAQAPSFPAFNTLLAGHAPGPAQQRAFGVNFTLFNAAIGLGGLVAAATVDVRHAGTFQAMFIGSAVASLGSVVVVLSVSPPPAPDAPRVSRHGYRDLVADPMMRRTILLCLLLALVGYGALESGLPAYANVVAKVQVRVIALGLTVNTLVIVGSQLLVLRLLQGRRRTLALATVGIVWCASWLLFGGSALPGSAWVRAAMVVAFAALFGIGETFMAPTLTPLINALAPEELRGRANALTSGMYSVAFVVSPAISATLISVGLGGAWIGLLCVGSLGATAVALWLSRTLPPARDIGDVALPPEPFPEPSAY